MVRSAAFGTPVSASRVTSNHSVRYMLEAGRRKPVHTTLQTDVAHQHSAQQDTCSDAGPGAWAVSAAAHTQTSHSAARQL